MLKIGDKVIALVDHKIIKKGWIGIVTETLYHDKHLALYDIKVKDYRYLTRRDFFFSESKDFISLKKLRKDKILKLK